MIESTITPETDIYGRSPEHKEGPIARSIEKRTAKVPSDVYLFAALGSMAASATLQFLGKRELSLFIGQWAPSILIMGLYNKVVKVAGSH